MTRFRLFSKTRALLLLSLGLGALAVPPGSSPLVATAAAQGKVSEVWVTNQAQDRIVVFRNGEIALQIDLTGKGDAPHLINFSSDRRFAYVANVSNGAITSIRTGTHTVVANLVIPGNPGTQPPLSHQAAPVPDGSRLVVAHIANRTLYEVTVDEKTGGLTLGPRALPLPKAPVCTVFTSDGSTAYVSLMPSGIIALDMESFTQVGPEIPTEGAVQCGMQRLGNGTFLVSSNGGPGAASGRLYRLSPADHTVTAITAVPGVDIHGVAASPDETKAYLSARGSDVVQEVDLSTQTPTATFSVDVVTGARDTPDQLDVLAGNVYVALREVGRLAIINIASGLVRAVELGGNLVHGVTVLDKEAPISEITSPNPGDRINNRRFRGVSGVAADDANPVLKVQLALKKRARRGCRWFTPTRQQLVRRPCDRPFWFTASGTHSWSYSFERVLPGGRYQLRSRATDGATHVERLFEAGRNKITFRLV